MYSLFELYTMFYRGNGNPVSSAKNLYHLVDTYHFFQHFYVNRSFPCQFFINEITASDAGPDIIRFHLFIWLLHYGGNI